MSFSPFTQDLPSKTARLLPADYIPGRSTVVVAKGNVAAQALGNSALRNLIQKHASAYTMAGNKRGKTKIVYNILEQVKDLNPNGVGFVKLHQGRWFESSDNGARDIITARFRDALCHQYKSSTKCKVIRRRNHKALCRAMQQHGVTRMARSSSTASVVSTDDQREANHGHHQLPELEPLPLDAPEPVVSSFSYSKLQEMLQSRERVPVVPLMAASSAFVNDVATPCEVPSAALQRRRSCHSIAGAVKSILEIDDEVTPLEAALDQLCEFEFDDIDSCFEASSV